MRIGALSDQHGHLVEIPACDLLIVAGDVCPDRFGPFFASLHPDRQKAWFDGELRAWLAESAARRCILTWGNHDWCGQVFSFAQDAPAQAASSALQIVVDETARVPAGDGSGAPVVVWATPWSNEIMHWAFMKPPEQLAAIYAAIPEGIDILVSHQPPFGYGDASAGTVEHLGSRELLVAIDRIKPKLVICGHIHGGFGRYEHHGIPIYNVSVVDDQYRLVNPPTVIELP